MKITKTQLKQIIREALDESALSFGLGVAGAKGTADYLRKKQRSGGRSSSRREEPPSFKIGGYTINADDEVRAALEQAMDVVSAAENSEKLLSDFESLLLNARLFTNHPYGHSYRREADDAGRSYDIDRKRLVAQLPLLDDVIPRVEGETLVAPTTLKHLEEQILKYMNGLAT